VKEKRGSLGVGGLTPLIDTLFLLLFALLAVAETKSETSMEEVHVRLPKVEPGADAGAVGARAIAIEVDADSRVRVFGHDEEVATRADLDRALSGALADRVPEEVPVEIRADGDARYGVTVELLQHLRLSGFADVRLTALSSDDPELPLGGGER
jgi:biopolymer transport protein ExbD